MVTVYSKNNCVQCKMTKRFLDSNNVAYREINLDEQPESVSYTHLDVYKRQRWARKLPSFSSPK